MKRIIHLCVMMTTIGIFTVSCSSGVVTSNTTALYEAIPHEQVQHIERLIQLRLTSRLPFSVDLRHEIKSVARQKGVSILYDETYWLLWAQDKYAAFMNPNQNSQRNVASYNESTR